MKEVYFGFFNIFLDQIELVIFFLYLKKLVCKGLSDLIIYRSREVWLWIQVVLILRVDFKCRRNELDQRGYYFGLNFFIVISIVMILLKIEINL